MPLAPTDIVQSFWLRFWREPRHPGQWRGTVWHEQQTPGEKPSAVDNPEKAFDMVRCRLNLSIEVDAAKDFVADLQERKLTPLRPGWHQHPLSALSHLFFALWRRFRGGQP